ncbi:hypothetical protein LM600727_20068 [Listeria monocytogenes]|nr:hypothetical protein LM600727_20068 [Listeria monocytogenes]CUK77625.1 hypothetical protein LM601614_20111 [Listeria monocytogenes]CUK78347.1 hypothetical protein LM700514_30104 [Listeria monocytogenes]CUL11514.1 hypothetical protein LM701145_40102 [Listeria monocytogenes]
MVAVIREWIILSIVQKLESTSFRNTFDTNYPIFCLFWWFLYNVSSSYANIYFV